MNIQSVIINLKKRAASVDWMLLAFLILFLNVKTGVKIAAIILIYLLQFNLKFGFRLRNSRLPLFYPVIIVIAAFNWIIFKGFTNVNYNLVFVSGIGFWLLCILAIHQLKSRIDKNTPQIIHNTILLFLLLNACVSVLMLLNIIREIHTLNPYRYQGQYQKYFIGTGDYIKGLTFDVSTTNAVLNAFGVVYFLIRTHVPMLLLCMAVMLLTGSNSINMMLAGILVLLFLFKTDKDQKSLVIICAMFLAVFIFKVSPQNDEYVLKIYRSVFHKAAPVTQQAPTQAVPLNSRPDSTLSADEKKEKTAQLYLDSLYRLTLKKEVKVQAPVAVLSQKQEIPQPDINSAPYQSVDHVTPQLVSLLNFIELNKAKLPLSAQQKQSAALPGKLIALQQTGLFFREHPGKLLTGNGLGNFSSKIAFKATGLGFAGKYPVKYAYINTNFLTRHLDVYLNFFSRSAGFHSLINTPNSVYDQLAGEYGLAGLAAFLIGYVGYYAWHFKRLTYGMPLLALMMGVFLLDYWFEQLSVIVFFELLMLLDIKEGLLKTAIE